MPPRKRSRSVNWVPSDAPPPESIAAIAALCAEVPNQALPIYRKLKMHWEKHGCSSFVEAIKSAIALQLSLKHKYSSMVTFLSSCMEEHLKHDTINRVDQAALRTLQLGLERNAALQGREQAVLVSNKYLLDTLDSIKDVDTRDVLLFICGSGYRVEDLSVMKFCHFHWDDEKLRIDSLITKSRKKQSQKVVWSRPLHRLWEKKRILDMLVRRRSLSGNDGLVFQRADTGKPVTAQRVQQVINSVESKHSVEDPHLTSYCFRLRFINEAIEAHRHPSTGIVQWKQVQEETLHLDEATLKSAYDRLVK